MTEPENTESVERPPGLPKWLKRSALVVLILILLLVLVGLIVGGNHGPGQHGPPIENGLQTSWL